MRYSIYSMSQRAYRSLAERFFGEPLIPGTCCADHGKGLMKGFKHVYPEAPLAGCWAHVAWGFSYVKKGFLNKKHKLYQEAQDDFHELHTCQSEGMWDICVEAVGWEWGDKDPECNTLWSEKLVAPCNNWYLGYTETPGATPSNQPQENWHNVGVMQALGDELRASTEYVLEVSLPKILKLDGATIYCPI